MSAGRNFARLIAAVLVLAAAALAAQEVTAAEAWVFEAVNHWPGWLWPPMVAIMTLGWLPIVPVLAALAVIVRRRTLALDVLAGGVLGWAGATASKLVAGRPRPGGLVADVVLRGPVPNGLGFPSGHVAVAAALATVAGAHVPRFVRRIAWVCVVLVGIGRMYAGAHLPLDVVGGAALGVAVGLALRLVWGRGQVPRVTEETYEPADG